MKTFNILVDFDYLETFGRCLDYQNMMRLVKPITGMIGLVISPWKHFVVVSKGEGAFRILLNETTYHCNEVKTN